MLRNFILMIPRPTRSTLVPYTALFRSRRLGRGRGQVTEHQVLNKVGASEVRIEAVLSAGRAARMRGEDARVDAGGVRQVSQDRKSTRLNSSYANISYAAFCLKKKTDLR